MDSKYIPTKYAIKDREKPISGYSWEKTLSEVKLNSDEFFVNEKFVSVNAFSNTALKEYFVEMQLNTLVEVEHQQYQDVMGTTYRTYWLARIQKVAGYRVLLSWLGADELHDRKHMFWMNLGSEEVCSVGFVKQQKAENKKCTYVPPVFLCTRLREKGFDKSIDTCLKSAHQYNCIKELNESRLSIQQNIHIKEGTRFELLDYNYSKRVRPAVVLENVQGRLRVQVRHEDCNTRDEEDRQYDLESQFWVDQRSFFVLPVGWATYNGYELAAKRNYIKHAEKIAEALNSKKTPPYASFDLQPHQLEVWRATKNSQHKWSKGMSFELMDPLGATIRDLYVATCLEVLKDGYLRVAVDGPDAEEECLPLHSSSSLLFPIGYANRHGLKLQKPDEDDSAPKFNWEMYLKCNNQIRAPTQLFKPDPELERTQMFRSGARLEAADLCENVFICAATVVGHKGRLLHVHFDGWDDTFDQYFDIDSTDLFPIGWCEMNGYKLEEPLREKRKNKK